LILNKINYIFAFCIKQTKNQDLNKPEIILFYDYIDEMPHMLRYSVISGTFSNTKAEIYGILYIHSLAARLKHKP